MAKFAAALLILALAGASDSSSHNPLFPGADPDMISACGSWWLFSTNQGPGPRREFTSRLFAWRSSNLRHWVQTDPILRIESIPWINEDGASEHYLWAPSVTASNGRFYLFYSVGPQGSTPSRLGVAVARQPAGPYVDSGRPLLTGGNGFEAIDPMVFRDPRSGVSYLYAGGSAGARLRVFEMEQSLLALKREVPVETPRNFTEGAFMHERNGIYYLSYSHGRFNGPDYSVHYSTAPSALGPWTYRGAVLTSDERHQGPGHHSFIRSAASGEWFIAYHRWDRTDTIPPFTGMRMIAIERIGYDREGRIIPVRMTDGPPPRIPAPRNQCRGGRSN